MSVTVRYRGNVIASLTGGQTATLKCAGEVMENDIEIADLGGSSVTPSGTTTITANGTHDVTNYATAKVNVPVPAGYIKPSGSTTITANGVYDVTDRASVSVNVASGGGNMNIYVEGDTLYINSTNARVENDTLHINS